MISVDLLWDIENVECSMLYIFEGMIVFWNQVRQESNCTFASQFHVFLFRLNTSVKFNFFEIITLISAAILQVVWTLTSQFKCFNMTQFASHIWVFIHPLNSHGVSTLSTKLGMLNHQIISTLLHLLLKVAWRLKDLVLIKFAERKLYFLYMKLLYLCEFTNWLLHE